MRHDFLPRKDADLKGWTGNFARQLRREPSPYPVSPAEAAAYGVLQRRFAERLQAASDEATRGIKTVYLKDETRRELVAETRRLAKRIRGADVEPGLLLDAGLTVPTPRRKVASAVEEVPWLVVEIGAGGVLEIGLGRPVTGTTARPAGATGALLLACVRDAEPPRTLGAWAVVGTTTTTRATLRPGDVPGCVEGPDGLNRLWLSAAWVGPRLQVGGLAEPVRAASAWGSCLTLPANNGQTFKQAA